MGKMKNFGTSETMQTLMRKSVCALLSLLLLLSVVLPVKAAAETAPAKVVRVGSFEDTFNYVNEKDVRKGYGYESRSFGLPCSSRITLPENSSC